MELAEYKETKRPILQGSRIPPRYEGKSFELCDSWCFEWILQVLNGRVDKSPMLAGATGVGKTTQLYELAKALCKEINRRNLDLWNKIDDFSEPKYRYKKIRVISEIDLFFQMREVTSPQAEYIMLKYIRMVDVLMIDDLGTAKLSDKTIEIMFNVIDYRLKHCLSTVITTNKTMEEIAVNYGERIASKLSELCKVIVMEGKDHRVE